MTVVRSPYNPIISPEDVKASRPDFEVICAFNAGVAHFENTVILLLRIAERPIPPDEHSCTVSLYDVGTGELVLKKFDTRDPDYDFSDPRGIHGPSGSYLTSLSHLRVARSSDGIHFDIEETPALFPKNIYEIYGIEDPRISCIAGQYYINYTAVSCFGTATALASTRDFVSFQRHGVILAPDNKDVTIFPEKIRGKYYALHRPSTSALGRPEIWIAESPDLICWGNHRHVMGLRDTAWDSARIGASAVPFRTEQGWLEIYHGADKNHRYCLGAVLLSEDEPWNVIARSRQAILEPEVDYELEGFFGNVVFSCGVLYEDGLVKIYYGASDTSTAYAEISIDDILHGLVEEL
ncbi:MAG: glycosidase [bacterium]|nr:glycosidase [bacterium]